MAKKEQSDDSKKVEFKDFKKSVTRGEFEAILEIARREYDKLVEVLKSSDKFESKINDGIQQIEDQEEGMPPGLAKKLIDGLKKKAKNEVGKMFSKEIARQVEITDFLNRFQDSDKILPYLDFTFLKNK